MLRLILDSKPIAFFLMPISRDAFQIGVPSSQDDGAEEFADAPDMDQSASAVKSVDRMDGGFVNSAEAAMGDSTPRSEGTTQAREKPQRDSKEDLTRLPPADPTSAEKKEAFGAAYPQRAAAPPLPVNGVGCGIRRGGFPGRGVRRGRRSFFAGRVVGRGGRCRRLQCNDLPRRRLWPACEGLSDWSFR